MSLIDQLRAKVTDALHTVTGLTKLAFGAADNTKVDSLTQTARITACENCPNFSPMLRNCGICKCFMDIKTAYLYDPVESEKQGTKIKTVCPVGNW